MNEEKWKQVFNLVLIKVIPLLLIRISKPLENKGFATASLYSNFNLLTFLLTFR